MTDDTDTSRSDALRLLRAEVNSLVKTIPGQVASVSLRAGEHALEVTWTQPVTAGSPPLVTAGSPPQVTAGSPAPMVAAEACEAPDPGVQVVTAPLVGTFYVAPEPGASPFVQVGGRIEAGQTVGIVEAMKLMNPVSAEWGGEVVEVLVADAEAVEFGQALVRIRADAP